MLVFVFKPGWRRKHDNTWTLVAALLGAVALLGGLVALLLHQFATSWQPTIVLAAFAHDAMWAAPVAVLLFALARRWYAVGAAVLVLGLVVFTQAPLYQGSRGPARGVSLTVLQTNLRVGSAHPAAVVGAVSTHHVDVLMTEELTPDERDRLLSAGLAKLLPYRFDAAHPGGGRGLAVWSRFSLSNENNYPGFQLGVLSATLRVSATESATVFAVHLVPPYPYPSAEWLSELKRLHQQLRHAAADHPVVVAGDFNATTDHAQYRSMLTGGYQDAAEHCGAGYWPATRPTGGSARFSRSTTS